MNLDEHEHDQAGSDAGHGSATMTARAARPAAPRHGAQGTAHFRRRVGTLLARRGAILVLAPDPRLSPLDAGPGSEALDEAISAALAEHDRVHDAALASVAIERQGFLAHELRGHLGTAMLALHLLRREGEQDTATTAILDRSLRGLRELIDRSVSEVRLASGNHWTTRLGVAGLIDDVATDASLDAANRGLDFRVEHDDAGLEVQVDRHLLAAAISNLLRNAFKFTRPHGRVTLGARRDGDRVAIEVRDECGGLPAGANESLFLPYEQRGDNHEGLGLGLAISRRAIEADGGTLSLRDLPGEGCIFRIELPLAP